MENLNNNSENTNQDSDFDSLSNMPSFEDMRKQNAVPEGVRDEQDYREYLAEKQARAAEQEKAGSEFAEHSKKYIAEIAKLEDSADKYMAIASLTFLTNEKYEDRKNDSINTQDVVLEFLNRDDKSETIKDFITNKVNNLRNSGASEDAIKHYDIPHDYGTRLERYEKGARIYSINQAEEEVYLDELNDRVTENDGLSGLEFYEYKTSEKRPANDRGIIINMTEDLLEKNKHEENAGKRALNSNKIQHLIDYYNGRNFDRQLASIKDRFFEVSESAVEGGYEISPKANINMVSIMRLEDNLKEEKSSYSSFCAILDKGQELLNNSL